MRRTKEEAEQTKKKILKAALDIFSEKSYDTATLNDIAKKADVTRGAIYWHFEDKKDILKELTDIHFGDFLEKAYNETLVLEGNSLEKIENLFTDYFEYFLNNPDNMKFKRIIDIKMAFDENNIFVQDIFGEIIENMIKKTNEIIVYGQSKNEIRQDIDAVFFTGTILNWITEFDRMDCLNYEKGFSFLDNKELILKNILKILQPL